MSLDRTQAEALEEIGDTIETLLKSKTQGLKGVEIVRGDRANKPAPRETLWIFEDTANITFSRGLTETWVLSVQLVAVIASANPKDGKARAVRVVSAAMSAMVENRRLGLEYVQDVKKQRLQFIPPRQPDKKSGLHAVGGIVEITFNIREGE